MLSAFQSLTQAERERQEVGFAWLMDKRDEERRKGGSVDVHIRAAQDQKCLFTIMDLPGSRRHLKNLAAGLSGADSVVLVVDASLGRFEADMEDGGSNSVIRQLILMVAAFGLTKSLVVAVNKMEAVKFDQARFKKICESVESALRKQGVKDARFIPISALHKHNIDSPSDKMPWHTGSTFFEALRSVSDEHQSLSSSSKPQLIAKPLRVTLRDIYLVGGIGACACGRIEAGCLEAGQEVVLAPSGLISKIRSIEVHGRSVIKGEPGDFVGITLEGVLPFDLHRGMVMMLRPPSPVNSMSLPLQVLSFEAKIIVHRSEGIRLKRAEQQGKQEKGPEGQSSKSKKDKKGVADLSFVLFVHSVHCACRIKRIVSKIDKKTREVLEDAPDCLSALDFGVVEIEPLSGCPLYLEEHPSPPIGSLGRMILCESVAREKDLKLIAATGIVSSVTWKQVEVHAGSLFKGPGGEASASSGA